MRALTMFYSWQSDAPPALGNLFVRRALEEAAVLLRGQGKIDLKIDSDTRGVPGTPAIVETLLGKIRNCDIFLADVTLVGSTPRGKLMPNPNVMGEFGYALRDKGSTCILLVMNEAFGSWRKLPFDLQNSRKPAGFFATAETSPQVRETRRSKLAKQLASYIELAADSLPEPAEDTFRADLRAQLETLAWECFQQRLYNDHPAVIAQPNFVLDLVTEGTLRAPPLDLSAIKAARHLMRPDLTSRSIDGNNARQWWSHGPTVPVADKPNPEAEWFCRLVRPGWIEWVVQYGRRIGDDPQILVGGRQLEAALVNAADKSLALARATGLAGDAVINIVLYETTDVEVTGGRTGGRLRLQSMPLPKCWIPAEAENAGDHLRDAFEAIWLEAGFEDGSPSFRDGGWAGYRDPAAYD